MTRITANLLFLMATIGWGASYLFTKIAVFELAPFTLVAIRFGLAFTIAFVIFYKKLITVTQKTLMASGILGILMCLMFSMFNVVLKTVPSATASFLLATTVIFVPLFTIVITRKLPQRQIVIGGIVTFSGLIVFMFDGGLGVNRGVLLSVLTAMAFAIHLVINNFLVKSHDALQLGVYQLGFTSIFGCLGMLAFEPIAGPKTTLGWISVFVLAIVCSAFGFVVQSVAQQYTSAVETGFILALEPVFAAIFAFVFLGEVLQGKEWLGAIVILSGVFIACYQRKGAVTVQSHLQ